MYLFAFIQVQKAVVNDGLLKPLTKSLHALTISLCPLHKLSDTWKQTFLHGSDNIFTKYTQQLKVKGKSYRVPIREIFFFLDDFEVCG
jgi:hypothetical protein